MWMGIIQSVEALNRTKLQMQEKIALCLMDDLGHCSSNSDQDYTIGFPGSWVFGFGLELYH